MGTDLDIVVARSTDNGATWSAPVAIDPSSSSDTGADERVSLGYGDGVFVAIWQSFDGLDYEIKWSRSANGGLTWSTPQVLTTNGSDDTLPSVASDGVGNWVAAWQSNEGILGGEGDLLTSRSSDGGVTWTSPLIVNPNAISDTGADLRPRIATDGFGTWILVWDSDATLGGTIGSDLDIFFARSTDAGATWSAQAALDFATASTDTGNDANPDIATDGTGAWTVVWDTDENLDGTSGTDFDLGVSRSTDDGLTWSVSTALNADASTDTGGNYFPRIATQPGGVSVVTWHSDDPGSSGYGTDFDVFYAGGLKSDTVTSCAAAGVFAASTGSLGYGENHYCEGWSLVTQTAADLSDSFLAQIDLSSANLSGSALDRSDLRGAVLTNVDLFNASLVNTILVGADLTGANLASADLAGAYYDERTLFPSGNDYSAGGWGLSGGITPWDAGMIPVPEPGFRLGLAAGAIAVLGLRRRVGSTWMSRN